MVIALDLLYQHLFALAVALTMGVAVSGIAWANGFYSYPLGRRIDESEVGGVNWRLVVSVFAIFLIIELFVVPLLYFLWLSIEFGVPVPDQVENIDAQTQGWVNIISIVCVSLGVGFFYCSLKKSIREAVWGRQNKHYGITNFLIGAGTWVIVYPLIIALSQFIAILLQFSYQGPPIEQIAVKHVKDALEHPLLFWTTSIVVVTIVPIVEELLFRGFLQTWLKSFLGRGKAIVVTAAIFACFHFSTRQGIENVELLVALFVLACYLGFLRERQRSLWASIGLHSIFNFVSVSIILLGGE